MVYQYRITKYSPEKRDKDGKYLGKEWTSFSEVGKTFDGKTFTLGEYYQIEDSYILAARSFLNEARIDKLTLTYLENAYAYQESGLTLQVGKEYVLQDVERLFRLVLQEKIWGKFEWQDKAYVHFGWDYYMYLGVATPCPQSLNYTRENGLFVEPFASPYLAVE